MYYILSIIYENSFKSLLDIKQLRLHLESNKIVNFDHKIFDSLINNNETEIYINNNPIDCKNNVLMFKNKNIHQNICIN